MNAQIDEDIARFAKARAELRERRGRRVRVLSAALATWIGAAALIVAMQLPPLPGQLLGWLFAAPLLAFAGVYFVVFGLLWIAAFALNDALEHQEKRG